MNPDFVGPAASTIRRQRTYTIELNDEVPPSVDEDSKSLRSRLVSLVLSPRFRILPVPGVAAKFNQLAGSSRGLDQVMSLVERDASIAGELLKLGTLSRHQLARPTLELRKSVARIGTKGLHDFMLSICRGEVFRCEPLQRRMRDQYLHNFAVARGSAMVFAALGISRTKGYVCGLLHDVGHHAILAALASYARRDERWLNPELVDQVLSTHHGRLGALIVARWKLPPLFGEIARYHDAPTQALRFGRAVQGVALANAADRFNRGTSEQRVGKLKQLPWVKPLGLSDQQLEQLVATVDSARQDEILTRLLD